MISMLFGTIAGQERDTVTHRGTVAGAVVVNCGGVGYGVRLGPKDASTVKHGKSVTVFCRQVFRENDLPLLFGWFNERDRALFDSLLKINGCGPVTACNVVDVFDVDELRAADPAAIARRVDGVGKVMAQRIYDAVKA
jgi:Holliday junction DNA helicase RuvA